MPRKCKPIPYQKFPKKQKIIDGTNCLAFALGIKRAKRKPGEYGLEKTEKPIEITFLEKVKELGFDPKDFTLISKEDESKTQGYIIRLYGFSRMQTDENGENFYDFHLIRREPNGQWVHKPGFYYQPREVTGEDWYVIFQKFGNRYVSFAVNA